MRVVTTYWPLARIEIVRNAMVSPTMPRHRSLTCLTIQRTSSVCTQTTLLSASTAHSLVESLSNFKYARCARCARCIVKGMVSQYLAEHASDARMPRKGLPMEVEDGILGCRDLDCLGHPVP